MMAVVINPIRGSNFYIGAAPELTPGTPAAPIYFFRWLGGTQVAINMNQNTLKEGDGTRRNMLVIKSGQTVTVTLVACLRPDEAGYIESVAQGANSDTYTAPAVATTLSADATAGATSITVTANTGLTGSGTLALVLGAGSSIEEIVTVNLPATGSSGSYVLTLANSGTLKINHTSGNTVKSKATHVIIDQTDGGYTTLEAGFGNLYGAGGTALRIRSCKVVSIKRKAKSGEALKHEVVFTGIASTVQSTPATVTLEQHPVYLFTQSAWTLDGSITGDAPNLESFEIDQKNNLDETQTEQLTLAALSYGDLEVTTKFTITWTSASRIYKAYFNDGVTDAQQLGLGSLNVLFSQPNGLHTLAYNILTLGYLNAQPPTPHDDGKHYTQDVEGTSLPVPLLGAGPNNPYLLQVTTTNTTYASY